MPKFSIEVEVTFVKLEVYVVDDAIRSNAVVKALTLSEERHKLNPDYVTSEIEWVTELQPKELL